MDTLTPRYVIARDARLWRVYDNQQLCFVAGAMWHSRKADARADTKKLNDAGKPTT